MRILGNTPPARQEDIAAIRANSIIEAMPALERRRLTTRLVDILAGHPYGLTKEELLAKFYEGFQGFSEPRRASLEVCMNKLIQRTRARFWAQGLDVIFVRASRRWHLVVLDEEPSYKECGLL